MLQRQAVFIIALLSMNLPAPESAQAQIYNCDGRWTNLPCKGIAREVMPETTTKPKTAEEVDQERKKSALHGLTSKRFIAKQKWGVAVDISSAEYLCTKPGPSVETCLDKISELSNLIDTRTHEKEQLKVAEETNRLREEKEAQENNTAAVVIEKEVIVDPYHRRYPYVPPPRNPYSRPPHNPYDKPPVDPTRPHLPDSRDHREHHEGAGISFDGSGGGGRVSGTIGGRAVEEDSSIESRYMRTRPR